MAKRLILCAVGTLACFSIAGCSSDAGTTPTGDGGVPTADGATLPTGDGATAAECAALPPQELLAELPDSASAVFELGTEGAVVADPNGGSDTGNAFYPKTGVLLRVPKAGGGASAFHTPASNRGLASMLVQGADVFFMELDPASPSKSGQLFRKGFSDASATAIGTPRYDGLTSYIAGADATNVYLVSPAGAGFNVLKVDRASGSETVLAQLDSTQLGQAQLQGGFVWFYGGQGTGALYKTPITAAAAAQVSVTDKTCFGGGLLVGENAFFCGGSLKLTKYDAAFQNPIELLDTVALGGNTSAPRPQAVAGSEVLVSVTIPPKDRTRLFAVPITGGPSRPVACEVGNIRRAFVDANFAYFLDAKASGTETPKKRLYRTRFSR